MSMVTPTWFSVIRNDPDYKTILAAIRAAKGRMEINPILRHDSPGFRPNDNYIRWMKKWEVLPEDFDLDKDEIDVYETDKAYWRSLWHKPPKEMAGVK